MNKSNHKNNTPYNVGCKVKQQLNQTAIRRLLLNLNPSSAVLLREVTLILPHLGLLDLYGLDLTALEGFLHALLRELGRALYIDGLKFAVLIECISSDLGQDF